MPDTKCCAECGTPLPAYWPKGLCAQCALDGALGMTHAASQVFEAETLFPPADPKSPGLSNQNSPLGSFGDYDLLEEIARGGMGVVYKARQRKLGRIVAVKAILAGPLAGKEFVQRFRTEAAAAAILQHPNIVAIHDVGVHEGRHYFSMDYVEGPNLAQRVRQQPLPPHKAARYAQIIAEAIHYAHERGILHRDLKPSNVLIDLNDQPRITDFGLARRLDGESSLTMSGQVLGSPNFMPPEQAGGKRNKVGRTSDVYALGGILYFLLTGRAPFQAESLEEVIHQVATVEPLSPRLLNPSLPKDLETITLKCLEKESSCRYQTAQELGDELGRVLAQEPIHARPINAPEKLLRWCRRKPAVAGALGFAIAALLIGLAATSWQWRRAERLAMSERHERNRAEAGETNAQRLLYAANLNLVQQAWKQNNLSRVRELLAETATSPERGFEWYYWQRQTHLELGILLGHESGIWSVAFSPDGRKIVTGSADHTARVWEMESGKELLELEGHSDGITSVAFSPDGQRMVTGSLDQVATIWEAASGRQLLALKGHTYAILSVAFSPDGQRIVTGSGDGTAKVWETATGQELFTLTGHSHAIHSAAFSPDGRRIVTGSGDRSAKVWEAVTGRELLTLVGHSNEIRSVVFSPDGRWIVTGSGDRSARLWESASGRHLRSFDGHGAAITSVAFSPDGRRIVTGSLDQTAAVWDTVGNQERFTLKGHSAAITCVAFSRDGQHVVTGSEDQTARVWEASNRQEPITFKGHSSGVRSVAFSPDGRRFVTGSQDKTGMVWDTGSGKALSNLNKHRNWVWSVAFSRDGRRIVTGSLDETATIWDALNGKELFVLKGHSAAIRAVTFSPNDQRILTGSTDQTAKVWDANSGEALFTLAGHRASVWSAAFSPDGQRMVTGSRDGTAKVWDAATGKELLTFRGHAGWVWSASFSPDGQHILTGSDDQTARVWEAASGREILILKGHSGGVDSAAFSPDGSRIVTGSFDRTAKVWDATSGKELLTLEGHRSDVSSAAFSPDGQRIVTGSGDRTAKIWTTAAPQQVEVWRAKDKAITKLLEASQRRRAAAAEQYRLLSATDPAAIRQWLVLAPIAVDGRNGAAALDREQVAHEGSLLARAGERVIAGGNERVWKEVQLEDYYLDFSRILKAPTEWSVAYAACYLRSDSDQTGLLMKIGSDDEAKVWLNGKEIYRYGSGREVEPDDEDVVAGVQLKAGMNLLVFKVVNEAGDWRGAIRLTDVMGRPVKGVRVVLTSP